MNVILSIRPQYCEAIERGEKQYEFRRRIFKQSANVEYVFMYATAPVKRLVGAFTIDSIMCDTPNALWKKCNKYGGVSEAEFFSYFDSEREAYAIKIGSIKQFQPIDPKKEIASFSPPQSFCYVGNELQHLVKSDK